jgi:hypothetical protein
MCWPCNSDHGVRGAGIAQASARWSSHRPAAGAAPPSSTSVRRRRRRSSAPPRPARLASARLGSPYAAVTCAVVAPSHRCTRHINSPRRGAWVCNNTLPLLVVAPSSSEPWAACLPAYGRAGRGTDAGNALNMSVRYAALSLLPQPRQCWLDCYGCGGCCSTTAAPRAATSSALPPAGRPGLRCLLPSPARSYEYLRACPIIPHMACMHACRWGQIWWELTGSRAWIRTGWAW